MSAHTPGPWFVHKAKNGLPYRIIAPDANDHAPGKVGTAITRWGAISLPSSEEGMANACLIAAAPDLLEALEKAVKRQGFTNEELINARSAIAKAKGESPWTSTH